MIKRTSLYLCATMLAGLISVLDSCTPESCYEETNAYLKAWFYSEETGNALPPDSLTVYGLNRSSFKIYNKAVKPQPALLPLDASSQSCSFIVRINGITDTVNFTYTPYPHLISKECGYTFYFSIDTPVYSHNIINAVRVRKNTVTTLDEENIRIFY